MKIIQATALAMTALALPLPAIAQVAKPCVTPTEAKGLVTFALPDLIATASTKCKATLPAGAYLTRSGVDLADRYRSYAETSWPAAKAAIIKIAGEDGKMMEALPDEATKALIGAGLSAELGKGIKPESCELVSNVLEQLAPLPPVNTSNLIGIILEAVGNSKKPGSGPKALNICQRTSAITASK
jgi:hypothetical protein